MMIRIEKNNSKILEIRFNRPRQHNAFNAEMISDLSNIFRDLQNDSGEKRVVLLRGEGKSFSAGADLQWMNSMHHCSLEDNKEDAALFQNLLELIVNCPLPVIAFVHGNVFGGGLGLLSVVDYCLAERGTVFGFTEVNLGLIPAIIAPYVIAVIGNRLARSYFLSGEKFSVERALEMNLVQRVEDKNSIEGVLRSTLENFLQTAPKAQILCKRLILELQKNKDDPDMIKKLTVEKLAHVRISKEAEERMMSILEKKQVVWS